MAGGPIFPSSMYIGGANGNLSTTVYIPNTNTNAAGAMEGIGVVASLAAGVNAPCVLQFNIPETLPAGAAKLRMLAWANATSGTAYWQVSDGQTAPGSNIGAATLTGENAGNSFSQTWATADVIVENKIALATSPVVNDILTVLVTFNGTQVGGGAANWSLAAVSVWQFSLVWE